MAGKNFMDDPFSNMPPGSTLSTLSNTAKMAIKRAALRYLFNPLLAVRYISNFYSLAPLYLFPKRSVRLNFRNGKSFVLSGEKAKSELWVLYKTMKGNMPITPSEDLSSVSFIHKGRKMSLSGPSCLDLCYQAFFNYEYGSLPIKGKVVVDIGANIGDTAIFYAANGAKKVIACEPFPYTHSLAKKNIAANRLFGKIKLLNVAVGGKRSFMVLPEVSESTVGKPAANAARGRRVPVVTLADVVKGERIEGGLLKLDCEGAEYGILLSADNSLLCKFSTIVLEYHHGCKNIIEKLESAGFFVGTVQGARYYVDKSWGHPRVLIGILRADKK